MSKKPSGNPAKTAMTKQDASRIQRATAQKHGGKVPKDSFASRAQAAADKRPSN